MNARPTWRFRQFIRGDRWLYYAMVAIALPVMLVAYDAQMARPVLGEDFEPTPERPVTVRSGDVEWTATTGRGLELQVERLEIGQIVAVEQSEYEYTVGIVAAHSAWFGTTCLIGGLLFWVVAAFFFAGLSRDRVVRDFFWLTLLYGLAVMIGGVFRPREGHPEEYAFGLLQLVCLIALPLIFLHLSLVFPRRNPALDRLRFLFPALTLAAAVLVVLQSLAYLRFFREQGEVAELERAILDANLIADLLMMLTTAPAFVLLVASARRLRSAGERRLALLLIVGILAGVIPYIFLRTPFEIMGVDFPFDAAWDRLAEMVVPLFFVLVVAKYQFLDVDVLIRRPLISGLLAAAAVGVPTAILLMSPGVEPVVMVPVGIAAGVCFLPLKRAIGTWMDRTFFRIPHGYDRVLARWKESLAGMADLPELVRSLDALLVEALSAEPHAVAIREDGWRITCGEKADERIAPALEALGDRLGRLLAPGASSLPHLETAAFPPDLLAAGVGLAQPIRAGGGTTGYILLGRIGGGRSLIGLDLEFVAQVAAEAGAGIERIRLVQQAAEKESAHRRLSELNRLKNDFLSRVAHDLRTPLTSIGWSAANLIDGVAGEITEPQRDYLDSVVASSRHLDRLVEDLLEVSRMDQGRVKLVLESVDLEEVLADAVSTLRPIAAEKDVEPVLLLDDGTFRVRGDRSKIHEIAVNLLDNAVKYAPPGTRVEITAAGEEGRTGFHVRDHGPGFDTEDTESLFEQFRQGEDSPHSPRHGFGLGLYIVRSFVEMQEGRVSAANHEEGGAVVTCLFPKE